MEVWKDIMHYEGIYQVSSMGRIKSLAGTGKSVKQEKILKPKFRRGYSRVTLWKDGKGYTIFVHRLVAFHFIPNEESKPNINHIDGNRANNAVDNLEWCTQKENLYHAKHVTKNSTVISRQAFIKLYNENSNLTLQEFTEKALDYFR